MKHNFPFLILLVIVLAGLNIYQYLNAREILIENKPSLKENNNLISMLVEQEDGTYIEKKDNNWPEEGYILDQEKSGCENGGKISYINEEIKVQAIGSDRCYVYFALDNALNRCTLGYLSSNNAICKIFNNPLTANSLYYHDEKADYVGMVNYSEEAGDYNYRFAGPSRNVANYVCLDGVTKENNCQTDADLYRIIGMFKNEEGNYELKLIKATYATATELGTDGAYGDNDTYYWNSTKGITLNDGNINLWAESNLNKDNLNNFYYQYITKKVTNLENYITNHIWFVAGNDYQHAYTIPGAKKSFNYELGPNRLSEGSSKGCFDNTGTARSCLAEDLTYQDHIGLMYNSDYYYAANPKFWSLHGMGDPYQSPGPFNDYRDATQDNWLYINYGIDKNYAEWSITRDNDGTNVAFIIYSGNPGYLANTYISYQAFYVRPVFYLSSDTQIASGDGSKTNPYRLNLN